MSLTKKLEALQAKEQETLSKLQQQRDRLINQRKNEIFRIVEKTNAIELDNELLLGALALAKEASETNDEETLMLLKEKAKPFRIKRRNKNAA